MQIETRKLTFTVNLNPDLRCENCGHEIFAFDEVCGFGNGTGVCTRCAVTMNPEKLSELQLENRR